MSLPFYGKQLYNITCSDLNNNCGSDIFLDRYGYSRLCHWYLQFYLPI